MTLLSHLINSTLKAIPFECAICKLWPCRAFEGVSGLCQSCIQTHAHTPRFLAPVGLDDCVAAVHFDAPWSALIAQYKFTPDPGLARLFASLLLRDERVRNRLNQVDVLIPLPLAPARLAERGFNQALQIAKHLIQPSGTAHWRGHLDSECLIRTRDTAPQRSLHREDRAQNVAGAFALQAAPSKGYRLTARSLDGQHILLIDDVMTTGATLSAAAQPLRKAGAASVSAVVIARTALH